jgi:hypothetical protein
VRTLIVLLFGFGLTACGGGGLPLPFVDGGSLDGATADGDPMQCTLPGLCNRGSVRQCRDLTSGFVYLITSDGTVFPCDATGCDKASAQAQAWCMAH